MDADDHLLLREYTKSHSEQAFESLVHRYLGLVYSAALRQGGNAHAAEEIVQATFVILARKAHRLGPGVFLPSWLLRTVRFAAASQRRAASRRQRYETEAQMESQIPPDSEHDPVWEELAPLLDEAVASLKEQDRRALLLRFYQAKTLKEVGEMLGVDEDAAQKRVTRAIERLRHFFTKRGLPVSAASLAALIGSNAVQAAPHGLGPSMAAAAMTQGALGSGSIAIIVQGALQAMTYAPLKIAAAIAISLALAGSAFLALGPRVNPSSAEYVWIQVAGLLATNSWDMFGDEPEMSQLVAIGPRAIPVLGELLEWKPEIWEQQAKQHGQAAPDELRSYLEDPEHRRELQRKAAEVIEQLGVVAARPLTSDLCHALAEPGFKSSHSLLRALLWSLPESPKAIATLSNYLADPTGGFGLFGTVEADGLWPKLPQFIPQLVRWLGNSSAINDAARGLGSLGTNARSALPALIEVADDGVHEPVLELEGNIRYSSPLEPYLGNRMIALRTLGEIGIGSPEVIDALKRGVADPAVRVWALQGFLALGQPSRSELAQIFETATLPRSFRTEELIRSIGELGPKTTWALAWLKKFTEPDFLASLEEPNREWRDTAIPPDQLRRTAIVAICRIQPSDVAKYLPELATPFNAWSLKKIPGAVPENAAAIRAALEPMLDSPETWQQWVAADLLLEIAPARDRALARLRTLAKNGKLEDRLQATARLAKATGQTEALIPLIRQGLAQADPNAAQTAIQCLMDLGPAGKAALPDLKAALWHKAWNVRNPAARALQTLAPEEVPPIR